MRQGINRAKTILNETRNFSQFSDDIFYDKTIPCVFISHKSDDNLEAVRIAEFFKRNGIDVFIDVEEPDLQKAVKSHNTNEIVQLIQMGLNNSTHLLALISDDTRTSWWVPYEIGFAKKGGKVIASLLLKKYLYDFPDFLKVEKTMKTIDDLKQFTSQIMPVDFYSNLYYSKPQPKGAENLYNYISVYR